MADSFVEEEVALEKQRLRDLFGQRTNPSDSQIATAKNNLNASRSVAKAKRQRQPRDDETFDQRTSKKRKESAGEKRDLALLVLLDQIQSLEITLIERYGEDFAENLAAEYLDEETYLALMAIEDQNERRHAIAIAISEAIANGSIDPDEISGDPELLNWLEKHVEKRNLDQQISAHSGFAHHDSRSDQSLESSLDAVFKV